MLGTAGALPRRRMLPISRFRRLQAAVGRSGRGDTNMLRLTILALGAVLALAGCDTIDSLSESITTPRSETDLRNRAQAGDQWSQLELAQRRGESLSTPDAETLRLLLQSSAQGNQWAQFQLGQMTENGRGVPRNEPEAARLYQLSAAQGNQWSQYRLGTLYRDGRGVPQDLAEAVRLLNQAAGQGNGWAIQALGEMARDGNGVPQDDVVAVAAFRQAAELGVPYADKSLGDMYRLGRGVPQDFEEARRYYQRAADANVSWASLALAEMAAQGQGGPVDTAGAAQWYLRAAGQEDTDAVRSGLDSLPPLTRLGAAQRMLADLGYTPGAPGILDEGTLTAIRAFQTSENLPADGQLTSDLLVRLARATAARTAS